MYREWDLSQSDVLKICYIAIIKDLDMMPSSTNPYTSDFKMAASANSAICITDVGIHPHILQIDRCHALLNNNEPQTYCMEGWLDNFLNKQ